MVSRIFFVKCFHILDLQVDGLFSFKDLGTVFKLSTKIHSSDPGICGAKGERYREPTRFTRQGDPRFGHFGSALDKKKYSGILLPERNLQGTCISLGFAVLACVATNVVPWNVSLNF